MIWTFNRDRLTALREAHGVTQDELADKIGTSKQHVSRWETGDLTPSTKTILKIANQFKVSPIYFFAQVSNKIDSTEEGKGEPNEPRLLKTASPN